VLLNLNKSGLNLKEKNKAKPSQRIKRSQKSHYKPGKTYSIPFSAFSSLEDLGSEMCLAKKLLVYVLVQ